MLFVFLTLMLTVKSAPGEGNSAGFQFVDASADTAGIVYVDSAIAVPGDGSSWASALKYLSDATQSANTDTAIKEIHIAKGTYYPTGDKTLPDIDSAFWLTRGGLKILGGYSNGGDHYDSNLYPTILSGDIGELADTSDNSSNVMIIKDIDKEGDSLIVDGLTITGGKSMVGRTIQGYGYAGGISITRAYANTVIRNCHLIGNYGTIASAIGIVGLLDSSVEVSLLANPQILNCLVKDNVVVNHPELDASPTGKTTFMNIAAAPFVSNCLFIQNKGSLGGVVSNSLQAKPVFNSCTFSGNSAKGANVIYNYQFGNTVLINCLLTGNFNTGDFSLGWGENISSLFSNSVIGNIFYSSCRLINTTIANNSAISNPSIEGGPLIFNLNESSAYMTNSIVWGNKSNRILDSMTATPSRIAYSIIQGLPADPLSHMQDGLSTQPLFIDTVNGNFQLVSPSPLINGGFNDSLTRALIDYFPDLADGGIDLAGNTRILDGNIDLGPFEFSGTPLPVDLQYFSGEWQGGLAALHWKSGLEEVNLDHYDIEKSSNGKDFQKTSSTKATGSNSTYEYKTAQVEPSAYYRLKAVAKDAKFDFSPIVKVIRHKNDKSVQLYPNPATNYLNVSVEMKGLLVIYDAAGSLVKSVNLKAGVNKIDISQLSAGAYFGLVDGQKLQFIKK